VLRTLSKAIDYFIPASVLSDSGSRMKVRTFIFLHLMGPAMGQSVILFLYHVSRGVEWQFWLLEGAVTSFWVVPFIVKNTRSLLLPAFVSVQVLVLVSLLGSFYYGGISSPFLPWFLIALLIGFFYLSDETMMVLAGVAVQLVAFITARLLVGTFPQLVPLGSLAYVNLISITAALIYVTLLSMYYETVMRSSAGLEEATRQHRLQTDELHTAMRHAESASQKKSIFLAKMSHELRTPLNAVIGYSEMLYESLGEQPANRHRAEDLQRINAAGRHLLALVTSVLDLSSIESNRQEIALGPVDLDELIRDVIATATPLVSKKDNHLVLQMARAIGVIQTDALKLRQSILNLLSNAAKFTSRGTITLNVAMREESNGDRLIIEVRDTGIGMTQDGINNIFKAFSQAEGDTAQKFGGTGLGLVLTKRFCNLMGGTIGVSSQRGDGSTFVIDLPCNAGSTIGNKVAA
jgi:signal transduction histidine kinase